MMKFLLLVILAFVAPSQQVFPGKNPDGRIISGETAFQGLYTFAASLYVKTKLGNYYCGGAILSDRWVITAAQCVDQSDSIIITVGSTKLSGIDLYRQVIESGHYVMHPSYKPDSLENDIALVYLLQPVTFSFTTSTIQILDSEVESEKRVIALGWGATRENGPEHTDELEWVNLFTISNAECEKTYGGQVKQSMMCAKGANIEGTCRGDMGSPLVEHIRGTYYRIVGIASFLSSAGCETNHPSGFTRIFHYLKWIEDTTGIQGYSK